MTVLLNRGEDVASFVSDRLAGEAEGAWVEAFGTVENAALEVLQDGQRTVRELPGSWDLVRLTASLGVSELGTALLARGGELVGGILVKAVARSVSVRVSPANAIAAALASPVHAAPVVGAPPVVAVPAASAPEAAAAEAAPRPAILLGPAPERVPEELAALRAPEPSDPGHPKSTFAGSAALPPKIGRKGDWIEELYPEEGDRVTHFAFGTCTVVGSDGERIRLQQDRDSRVREVALSMLKIAPPTLAEDGTRHWNLGRKN